MLSALDNQGRLINSLDQIPSKQSFTCPACASPVRLKAGKVMRPHFAHVSLQDCHFYAENESAEHLSLKAELYQSLSKSESVEIEKILPELCQIADLLVNEKLALEVQCSPLSHDRLHERTQSYQDKGFQVLWLLGKKLWLGKTLSTLQKQFLYFSQNMGFHCWELDLDQRQLRLNYLIHEDLFGKIHYLSKNCSFDADLMAFFRTPYQKQVLSSYSVSMAKSPQTYVQRQLRAGHSKWLRKQEQAYLTGQNLMTQPSAAFYPQVNPPESSTGFCQIRQDLSGYRRAFSHYYKSQTELSVQVLYPPAFYGKIGSKKN